jgi:hypothetical protein
LQVCRSCGAGFDISGENVPDRKEAAMKYMILIHSNPASREAWEKFSEAERGQGMDAYAALNEDLAESGELIVTEALADASTGKRVAVQGGRTIISDGPFAEAKEQLAGFYLVDCESVDRAIEIAAQVPGIPPLEVEVRPVLSYGGTEM